jgi:Ran GTPase-activating protein (RanGAP) involved in mRNA processing and transport
VSEGSSLDRNSKISNLFLEMMNFNKNSWNHLSLWKCQLGFTSIFRSDSRLQNLSTLTDICLQENELDDAAGVCIGDYMVTSWHSLRCLNLRENIIGDLGAQRILDGIRVNPNLEKVYIDRNHIRNVNVAKSMILFFFEQAKPGLRELDMSYNHVTEYRRNQFEIRRYLGEMKSAKFEDCDGYTNICFQDRLMRL